MTATAKWVELQRRTTTTVDPVTGKTVVRELPYWYGRMNVGGKWKWFRLYTDRRASQKRWDEIIANSEQREAGVITPQMDHAKTPLATELEEYFQDLQRRSSPEHYRITKNMVERFVKWAGWTTLANIDEASTRQTLSTIQTDKNYTVAHCNKYLTKIKSFLNWCVPDRLAYNPLRKLKKGNERKAVKRHAKRPLTPAETLDLLNTAPPGRRLKYALPIYTGLRRIEAARLAWDDVRLDATIPHLRLRQEMTKTGCAATIPLHPYLASLLKGVADQTPGTSVVDSIPEKRTVKQDFLAAGITIVDASGRRAGYHGLRYTFATLLDETGCSHGTRRGLMRHGTGDVTDGYTVARLSEMYDAVKRLPSPPIPAAPLTGKDTSGATNSVDISWTNPAPASAASGNQNSGQRPLPFAKNTRKNRTIPSLRQSPAAAGLYGQATPDIVSKTGTRSSVG